MRALLAVVVVVLLALVAAAGWEVSTNQPSIEEPLASFQFEDAVTEITLVVNRFEAGARRLSGHANVAVFPTPGDAQSPTSNMERASLSLLRLAPDYLDLSRSAAAPYVESTGGGTAPFSLNLFVGVLEPPAKADGSRMELSGTRRSPPEPMRNFAGTVPFSLSIEPRTDQFYFPFDSYQLAVLAVAHGPNGEGWEADRLGIEFRSGGLWATMDEAERVGGYKELRAVIGRPISIRILAVVMLVAAGVWLYYLARHAAVESQVGTLVAFVASIWGWRATIGQGETLFPSLSDYIILLLTILAVAIVLTRWIQSAPPPSRTCPYCFARIPAAATRCGHCTAEIPGQA